jgi:hypothetical protein
MSTRKITECAVVVLGRWNPAILTPSGVAKMLFKLPEGTPIEIQIVIDDFQPFRVRHDSLIVQVDHYRLSILVEEFSTARLKRAMEVACEAMKSLPETPFSACGVNFRYEILDPESETLESLRSGLDNPVSDLEFEIAGRNCILTLKDEPGTMRFEVGLNDKKLTALFNFHRESKKKEDLIAWLSRPVQEFEASVDRLCTKVLRVATKEVVDDVAGNGPSA